METLRAEWMEAPDRPAQQAIAARMQAQAFQTCRISRLASTTSRRRIGER